MVRKTRDRLFIGFTLVFSLAVAGLVGTELWQDNQIVKQSTAVPTTTRTTDLQEEPGFATYYDSTSGIGFIFPNDEDPIKASDEISNANLSVTSRNFLIRFYEAPQFTYSPFSDGSVSCIYDAALRQFQGSTGSDSACTFVSIKVEATDFLQNSFTSNELTRHVMIAPVRHGAYFMEIAIDYRNDCSTWNQAVCDARSNANNQKLEAFVRSIVVKNHELFQQ